MEYGLLVQQAHEMIKDSTWEITMLSNLSALLYTSLDRINWAGFYIIRNGELVLGPFQGKPACIRIPKGKGVCGAAVEDRKIVQISDVDKFPGHIVCDSDSKSEIVLPIFVGNEVWGVLDIDSPVTGRFDDTDELFLSEIVHQLEHYIAPLVII